MRGSNFVADSSAEGATARQQPRSAGMGPTRAPPPNERLTQTKPLLSRFRIPSPLLAGSAHKTAGQPEQEDSSGSPHAAGALSGASSSGGLSSPDASEQYVRGSPRRYSQALNTTPESQLGGMAVSPWAPWAALRLTPSPLLLQRKGHGAEQQHASNGADVQQHATAMQHSGQHALHGLQHDVAWRGDQDRVRHMAGVKAWSPTAGMNPAAAAVSAWVSPASQPAAPPSARSLPMRAGIPAAAKAAGMATPPAAVTTTLPADLTATNPALASARHNPLFESDGLGSPRAPDTSSPLRRTPPPALSGASHALRVLTQARQSFAFDGALAHANPTFTPSPTFGLAAAATLQRPGSPMTGQAWHAAQRQLQMQDGDVFSHQLLAGHGQPGSETGGQAPANALTRTVGGSNMNVGMSGGAAAGNAPLSSAQRGSMLVEQLMQELQELEEATGIQPQFHTLVPDLAALVSSSSRPSTAASAAAPSPSATAAAGPMSAAGLPVTARSPSRVHSAAMAKLLASGRQLQAEQTARSGAPPFLPSEGQVLLDSSLQAKQWGDRQLRSPTCSLDGPLLPQVWDATQGADTLALPPKELPSSRTSLETWSSLAAQEPAPGQAHAQQQGQQQQYGQQAQWHQPRAHGLNTILESPVHSRPHAPPHQRTQHPTSTSPSGAAAPAAGLLSPLSALAMSAPTGASPLGPLALAVAALFANSPPQHEAAGQAGSAGSNTRSKDPRVGGQDRGSSQGQHEELPPALASQAGARGGTATGLVAASNVSPVVDPRSSIMQAVQIEEAASGTSASADATVVWREDGASGGLAAGAKAGAVGSLVMQLLHMLNEQEQQQLLSPQQQHTSPQQQPPPSDQQLQQQAGQAQESAGQDAGRVRTQAELHAGHSPPAPAWESPAAASTAAAAVVGTATPRSPVGPKHSVFRLSPLLAAGKGAQGTVAPAAAADHQGKAAGLQPGQAASHAAAAKAEAQLSTQGAAHQRTPAWGAAVPSRIPSVPKAADAVLKTADPVHFDQPVVVPHLPPGPAGCSVPMSPPLALASPAPANPSPALASPASELQGLRVKVAGSTSPSPTPVWMLQQDGPASSPTSAWQQQQLQPQHPASATPNMGSSQAPQQAAWSSSPTAGCRLYASPQHQQRQVQRMRAAAIGGDSTALQAVSTGKKRKGTGGGSTQASPTAGAAWGAATSPSAVFFAPARQGVGAAVATPQSSASVGLPPHGASTPGFSPHGLSPHSGPAGRGASSAAAKVQRRRSRSATPPDRHRLRQQQRQQQQENVSRVSGGGPNAKSGIPSPLLGSSGLAVAPVAKTSVPRSVRRYASQASAAGRSQGVAGADGGNSPGGQLGPLAAGALGTQTAQPVPVAYYTPQQGRLRGQGMGQTPGSGQAAVAPWQVPLTVAVGGWGGRAVRRQRQRSPGSQDLTGFDDLEPSAAGSNSSSEFDVGLLDAMLSPICDLRAKYGRHNQDQEAATEGDNREGPPATPTTLQQQFEQEQQQQEGQQQQQEGQKQQVGQQQQEGKQQREGQQEEEEQQQEEQQLQGRQVHEAGAVDVPLSPPPTSPARHQQCLAAAGEASSGSCQQQQQLQEHRAQQQQLQQQQAQQQQAHAQQQQEWQQQGSSCEGSPMPAAGAASQAQLRLTDSSTQTSPLPSPLRWGATEASIVSGMGGSLEAAAPFTLDAPGATLQTVVAGGVQAVSGSDAAAGNAADSAEAQSAAQTEVESCPSKKLLPVQAETEPSNALTVAQSRAGPAAAQVAAAQGGRVRAVAAMWGQLAQGQQGVRMNHTTQSLTGHEGPGDHQYGHREGVSSSGSGVIADSGSREQSAAVACATTTTGTGVVPSSTQEPYLPAAPLNMNAGVSAAAAADAVAALPSANSAATQVPASALPRATASSSDGGGWWGSAGGSEPPPLVKPAQSDLPTNADTHSDAACDTAAAPSHPPSTPQPSTQISTPLPIISPSQPLPQTPNPLPLISPSASAGSTGPSAGGSAVTVEISVRGSLDLGQTATSTPESGSQAAGGMTDQANDGALDARAQRGDVRGSVEQCASRACSKRSAALGADSPGLRPQDREEGGLDVQEVRSAGSGFAFHPVLFGSQSALQGGVWQQAATQGPPTQAGARAGGASEHALVRNRAQATSAQAGGSVQQGADEEEARVVPRGCSGTMGGGGIRSTLRCRREGAEAFAPAYSAVERERAEAVGSRPAARDGNGVEEGQRDVALGTQSATDSLRDRLSVALQQHVTGAVTAGSKRADGTRRHMAPLAPTAGGSRGNAGGDGLRAGAEGKVGSMEAFTAAPDAPDVWGGVEGGWNEARDAVRDDVQPDTNKKQQWWRWGSGSGRGGDGASSAASGIALTRLVQGKAAGHAKAAEAVKRDVCLTPANRGKAEEQGDGAGEPHGVSRASDCGSTCTHAGDLGSTMHQRTSCSPPATAGGGAVGAGGDPRTQAPSQAESPGVSGLHRGQGQGSGELQAGGRWERVAPLASQGSSPGASYASSGIQVGAFEGTHAGAQGRKGRKGGLLGKLLSFPKGKEEKRAQEGAAGEVAPGAARSLWLGCMRPSA